MPVLKPQACHICKNTIRGSMFQSILRNSKNIICESCYRERHYGSNVYIKSYKHCILKDSIDLAASQRICRCSTVAHFDSDGCCRSLFPVDQEDSHRGKRSEGPLQCGLLNLNELVAERKYQGMLSVLEDHTSLQEKKRIGEAREEEEREMKAQRGGLKTLKELSHIDSSNRSAEAGNSTALEEGAAFEDVPFFLRNFTNRYPFGNVHMALRFGPLIIENGVEQYATAFHILSHAGWCAKLVLVLRKESSLQAETLPVYKFCGIREVTSNIA